MTQASNSLLNSSQIDASAYNIVKTLQESGFESYLVGGCVRDLLVGIVPKDFDIATSAMPNEVRRKIRNAYVIGKRFKLVLVKRGDQQYEIATFRRNALAEELEAEDSASIDNFFGTSEEDAQRRDFTVNAMFYDPVKKKLIDHCNGLDDIHHRTIRMIGDPLVRIKEDPIRALRALRLSHKLNFKIEASFKKAISEGRAELLRANLPRKREEWVKILKLNDPALCFLEMYDLGALETCLPSMMQVFDDAEKRERFLTVMSSFRYSNLDKSSPIELFAGLVTSMIYSMYEEIPKDLENHEKLNLWMREELGMFKLESSVVLRALESLGEFNDMEHHRRKGFRRQMAFVNHEHINLSFKLSQMLHIMTAEQRVYWTPFFTNPEIRQAPNLHPEPSDLKISSTTELK